MFGAHNSLSLWPDLFKNALHCQYIIVWSVEIPLLHREQWEMNETLNSNLLRFFFLHFNLIANVIQGSFYMHKSICKLFSAETWMPKSKPVTFSAGNELWKKSLKIHELVQLTNLFLRFIARYGILNPSFIWIRNFIFKCPLVASHDMENFPLFHTERSDIGCKPPLKCFDYINSKSSFFRIWTIDHLSLVMAHVETERVFSDY